MKLRILHTSDLHIGLSVTDPVQLFQGYLMSGLAGPGDEAAWSGLHRFLAMREDGPDVLVITGDVANTGSLPDLTMAATYVANLLRPIDIASHTLRPKCQTLVLVPGNHDRYTRTGAPGNKRFDELFSKQWGPGDVRTTIIPVQDRHVYLIAADFCLRTTGQASSFRGQRGEGICDERLEELVRETQRYPRGNVIWMVHFAPSFDFPDDYPLREFMSLIEGDKLIEAAGSEGVKFILCGHTHVERPYTKGDPPVKIFCAASAAKSYHEFRPRIWEIDFALTERGLEDQTDVRSFTFVGGTFE